MELIPNLVTLTTVALLLLNLAGLALLTGRWIASYALARVVSPIILAVCFCFVEHFWGLGRLVWLWPFTTAASAWVVLTSLSSLRKNWKTEAIFVGGFGYAFAWRFAFPSLNASSERIADLAMICSYLPGDRLPPVDVWLPPFRFDVYHSLQHYAAALMGRIFDLDPGTTYNLAFCVIAALTITAVAAVAALLCPSRLGASLVVAAFVLGGTGASWVSHFVVREPALYSGMRFIGGTATPEFANTAFGKWLISTSQVPPKEATELPLETFSYLTYLGDYHPPLSGFLLAMAALLCVVMVETGRESRFCVALLAGTLPVTLAANSWSVVPQGFIIGGWIAYRVLRRQTVNWRMLAAGFLAALILMYPFLKGFGLRSLDYQVSLRLVPPGQHTPVLLGLIVLYPLLLVIALQLISGQRNPLGIWFCAVWLGMLIFAEFFFVDDVYSGPFNRFNTVLKWWPIAYSGALLTLGAMNLASKSRLCRFGTLAVLGAVTLYALDLGRFYVLVDKSEAGRLDGAAWVKRDNIENVVLEYLKHQPRGTVLQRLETGAFTPAPALVLLAGQRAYLGWPEHEKLWRGYRADIDLRRTQVAEFYQGTLAESAEWLIQNQIDHVLWLKTENAVPPGTFERINDEIRPAYYWREFYRAGDFHVGIWTRRRR